jgi:hypothetical protein
LVADLSNGIHLISQVRRGKIVMHPRQGSPHVRRCDRSVGRCAEAAFTLHTEWTSVMGAVVTLRTTLLGLASWAIPFALSFLFFDRSGQLVVAQPLFKSIMVVVGGASGATLLVWVFRSTTPSLVSGLALGLYWLAINIALDLATLVVAMGMPISLYFIDIGLRYLLLPIFAAALGTVGAQAREVTR